MCVFVLVIRRFGSGIFAVFSASFAFITHSRTFFIHRWVRSIFFFVFRNGNYTNQN